MSAARTAAAAAADAERAWRGTQQRTRQAWDDVVRAHFDQLAADRFANALRNGAQAIDILDRELDGALSMLDS